MPRKREVTEEVGHRDRGRRGGFGSGEDMGMLDFICFERGLCHEAGGREKR
jgi:hypothetical protein